MGAPLESNDVVDRENPAGTDGIPFIEFSAADVAPIAEVLTELGFRHIANHRNLAVALWRQGDIDILLNRDPSTHGYHFSALHGPCISAISFRVADEALACDLAAKNGVARYAGDQGAPAVNAPAMTGIGQSLLYLMTSETEARIKTEEFIPLSGDVLPQVAGIGFHAIDHLTHNVMVGNMERWVDFYRSAFNFREVYYLDTKGRNTGLRTRAMKSPCDRICIPVNEPISPQSQIQEFIDEYNGEGVQHLALLSTDLNDSIEQIGGSGISLMSIPESYYEGVAARMPGHGQDIERLKSNSILIDGERDPQGGWNLLLQIFSKKAVGPIFFEFIERRGNDGFGDNNAKALFDAIEREQIERGVVSADK